MNISKEQMFELIRKQNNTTKEEVLKSLGKKMKRYTEEAEKEAAHPTTYYAILLLYLAAFYKKIEGAVLFDTLPDGWIYGFDYQYDEFSLNLEHVKEYNVDEDLEYRSMRLDQLMSSYTLSCRGLGISFVTDTVICSSGREAASRRPRSFSAVPSRAVTPSRGIVLLFNGITPFRDQSSEIRVQSPES